MDIIIGKEFVKKVIPLIDGAKNDICIIVYDWRNYKKDVGSSVFKLNQALISAVKRKVSVRVIIHPKNSNQKWVKDFFKTKELYSNKTIHTKMMIIDSDYLVIGSHNYTFSGLELNQEISVISKDKSAIQRTQKFFNTLF